MMNDMIGSGMMWGMGLVWLIVLLALILSAAALVWPSPTFVKPRMLLYIRDLLRSLLLSDELHRAI